MRRILRKILSGEEDSLGDISTVSEIAIHDDEAWLHVLTRNLALGSERVGEDH